MVNFLSVGQFMEKIRGIISTIEIVKYGGKISSEEIGKKMNTP